MGCRRDQSRSARRRRPPGPGAVDEADQAFSDEERARFIAFREAVEDGAEYDVYAIEV